MYLLYIDESGVPGHDPGSTHFVVLGLAIHESTWYALEARVAGVRRRFGLDPAAELHAAWILRRYRDQEAVRDFELLDWASRRRAVEAVRRQEQKKWKKWDSNRRTQKHAELKKTQPFIHLSRKERNDLVDAALAVVGQHRDKLYLIGEAINKTTLRKGIDPITESFDQVVSRLESFLRSRRPGRTWGLLVADHNETQAKRLPAMLRKFQASGTRWSKIDRVIEAPFFVDSASCSGIQLADCCSYALRRCLEKGEERRFEMIFAKFYRSGNKLVGLRHFTARKCPCMICRERQHD